MPPAARRRRARPRPARRRGDSGGADDVKVLDFSLDEVREARLVPVIDFKGRRFAARQARRPTRRAPQDEADGGRIQ